MKSESLTAFHSSPIIPLRIQSWFREKGTKIFKSVGCLFASYWVAFKLDQIKRRITVKSHAPTRWNQFQKEWTRNVNSSKKKERFFKKSLTKNTELLKTWVVLQWSNYPAKSGILQSPSCVCLFVCLFVCLLAGFLINYWSDFDEIWWVGR